MTGENLDPHKIWAAMFQNEKPGGHGERSVAIGTIDMAVWDAVAKVARAPAVPTTGGSLRRRHHRSTRLRLRRGRVLLSGSGSREAARAKCAAISTAATRSSRRRSAAPRSRTICGGSRRCLSEIGGEARLAVDANGRFDLATAIAYAKELRQFPLFWYEEPGDPLDYELQSELAQHYPGPMATGEDLFSMQDARNLIRYGGMRPGPRLAAI